VSMETREEHWLLTRDMKTGKVVRMEREEILFQMTFPTDPKEARA
jgi:hypothetical protein